MRKAEGLDRVVDSFVGVHAHASSLPGHAHRVAGLGIHFHVKEFRAKAPVRILGRKPEPAQAVVGWDLEVASLVGNTVEGEVGAAALLQLKIIILGQRHSGKNRKLDFGPAERAKRTQDEEEKRAPQKSRTR